MTHKKMVWENIEKRITGQNRSGAGNGSGKKGFFSIRNKLAISLLLPILFMIIIGAAAYKKAEQGMNEKFSESTAQTIQMLSENVDNLNDTAQALGENMDDLKGEISVFQL